MNHLWVTEPRRRTCLAEVTAVRGAWFQVDRALFAPRSRACRHPQPADKGTVWLDGEKRRLDAVRDLERGESKDVWYRLRGTVPAVGTRLQCELDARHRDAMSRAHTAMHLFIAASKAPMVADPEVKGDGHVRFTFAGFVAPKDLAAWLAKAQAWAEEDHVVQQRFMDAAEAAHVVTPQQFQPPDPMPGPDVRPVVWVADTAYPCDGTHVDRTARLGRLVVAHAAPGKDGFVVVLRA